MSQATSSEAFALNRFVLNYLEHAGAVVTPPTYGVYEVLLPDELAEQLGVDPYLRLTFDADAAAVRLSVNHPLVEALAERLQAEAGNAQVAINHVRLEKKGLFDLAARTLGFPNARLNAKRDAVEQPALHHYLRCNFKATFLGDEKQEQIVSVVLDVQGGYAIRDAAHLRQLLSYETKTAFAHLVVAPPRWAGAGDALAPETLQALLPRAQAAAEATLAGRLSSLRTRMQRLLELDAARLADYYDSLERDLRQRLARLDEAEVERRSNLEAKIAALQAERSAKLVDIEARYQLRVELELINVLLIVQPKVLLPVEISNRRTTITRSVVWDPLLHRIEPLVCDVCGEPGDKLHLCTGGHLAHRDCLAPQCVDCNRAYCRLCADQVLTCVVCNRPVCRTSSKVCAECGRVTCSEHQKLCHAAAGQPAVLPDPAAAAALPPAPTPRAEPQPATKPSPQRAAQPARPRAQRAVAAPARLAPTVSAVKLNVEIYEDAPRVVAYVMRSTNRVLATRLIELTPQGIGIRCQCEKTPCPADGWMHWPAEPGAIQDQVKGFLAALREEYYLPPKRTHYFYVRGSEVSERPTFALPPIWRDPYLLSAARQGFEHGR